MPNMSLMEQAEAFVRVHTWMPKDEAFRIALVKHEQCVPWCPICSDWHELSEEHSMTLIDGVWQ